MRRQFEDHAIRQGRRVSQYEYAAAHLFVRDLLRHAGKALAAHGHFNSGIFDHIAAPVLRFDLARRRIEMTVVVNEPHLNGALLTSLPADCGQLGHKYGFILEFHTVNYRGAVT